MKPFSLRQWVACAVMATMLFNMVTPFTICRCVDCSCEHNTSSPISKSAIETKMSCCAPPVLLANERCCRSPEVPCDCQCSNYQANESVVPTAVPSVKRPEIKPHWDFVSTLPDSVHYASEAFARLEKCRTTLTSHVPLHVLLCVFLN